MFDELNCNFLSGFIGCSKYKTREFRNEYRKLVKPTLISGMY